MERNSIGMPYTTGIVARCRKIGGILRRRLRSRQHVAGARVTVLCAPNDMWFSDAEFSQMEQEVPTVQV